MANNIRISDKLYTELSAIATSLQLSKARIVDMAMEIGLRHIAVNGILLKMPVKQSSQNPRLGQ